jgi:hypothetical protein
MGWTRPLLTMMVLTIGLVGCRSFNVRTDWDPAAGFDVFQRYLWVEPPKVEGASPFADNTLLRNRVRFVLEFELKQQGFQPTEERVDADFLVTYSVILDERLRLNAYSGGAGGGYYRRGYGGFGTVYSSASIREYQESTLIIDFLDPNNDDLVWRGWGSGIVRTRDRNARHGRLEKGIKAILKKFPPKEN